MGDTIPRRGPQYLTGEAECDVFLSLMVPVHWTIAKPYSLDRISVARLRLDRYGRERSTLGEHQHGRGGRTHVSFAGFRLL
jgi:hypothetical protein